ncbi:YhcH/YjgK/YiaL family protein [Streptococcus marmotae]|uniref:YhcH/YjgK/YiaL family protein n=1 Tax=Streptococcus marmotae TaxID=1825069 RepID=UPI0008318084|nr:YhcH/YjgK/YiaL family protein [Streptococcus marmotae]
MIIERIDCLVKYQALLKNIEAALAELDLRKNHFEEGVRYSFNGGFIFFQTGITKFRKEAKFETHRKYIDVQVILEGSEYLALADPSQLNTIISYDANKDVEKYEGEIRNYIRIDKGMAYVCFPWDAHQAVFHLQEPSYFKKAVIKLEI